MFEGIKDDVINENKKNNVNEGKIRKVDTPTMLLHSMTSIFFYEKRTLIIFNYY